MTRLCSFPAGNLQVPKQRHYRYRDQGCLNRETLDELAFRGFHLVRSLGTRLKVSELDHKERRCCQKGIAAPE